ncbi:hypothetical protein C7999DRAFT_30648 [Corynascus novoguineensis]|uniref:Uncharacterized protein n=1 Tax=Corynascus novoguineensis TaxID=1126955 RepID=A0AAN7HRD1_9PEZI|nr:hypothetical protein C7999DRAFT_30648 [Corynascus novoguineensis]
MAERCASYESTAGKDLVSSKKYELFFHPGDQALYKIVDPQVVHREETTWTNFVEEEFEVPPRTSVYVYQKEYRSRTQVWFKADAQAEVVTVGRRERPGMLMVSSDVYISAEEYLHDKEPLKSKGNLEPETVEPAGTVGRMVQFQNLPSDIQSYLHRMASRTASLTTMHQRRSGDTEDSPGSIIFAL